MQATEDRCRSKTRGFSLLPAARLSSTLMLALVTISGCGPGNQASVSGMVRVDGEPVESGSIRFEPIDKRGKTAGASIKEGKYEMDAERGPVPNKTYVIYITGKKATGKMIPVESTENVMTPEMVNVVPARYHLSNELQEEIKPGHNEIDFDLKGDQ